MKHRMGALAVITVLAVSACSSNDDSSAETPVSATVSRSSVAPEDVIAPDPAVAVGMQGLKALAGQIADAAATDSTRAKTLAAGLEPLWKPIEGTVKQNDGAVYLAVEDAFAQLESGDAGKSVTGASGLSTAVGTYLAAHPG